MKKIYILILGIIFLLGFTLRVYQLENFPSGFHRDEAFLGYNSYSLLKTGKDMSGAGYPFHLEPFLYTPAGYSYVSVPSIIIFGLNKFAIRFASAFFGSITIFLVYIFVKQLFSQYGQKLFINKIKLNHLALFSSFLLAVSPWHINLSRTASVSTLVVFFITLGIVLYMRWLSSRKKLALVFSFLLFGVSLLFYISPYTFLPIFIPMMVLLLNYNMKENFSKKKSELFFTFILFSVFILIPVVMTLSSERLSLRARSLSIFQSQGVQLVLDGQIREDGVSNIPTTITRVFHNKLFGYVNQFVSNYSKHFSFEFLFSDQGYPERYKVPLTGPLYISELLLILLGIWSLLKYEKRIAAFLLLWTALVPIGSSFTFDDIPNLQRTLFIFPAISTISAVGMFYLLTFVKNRKLYIAFIFLSGFIILFNFLFYLHQYYVHMRMYRPWYRHDGYQELVEKVNYYMSNYKNVIITDRESAPTIFFLFFNAYNPADFQKETKNSAFRGFDRISFGKYQFTQEECPLKFDVEKGKLTGKKGILYVNSTLCKIPEGTKLLDVIKRSDHSEVFQILALDN